ncbi:MAG: nucleoside kinase [Myxococcota bacterium]|nr:nucleoside kinase [Myxococcota bacterium]
MIEKTDKPARIQYRDAVMEVVRGTTIVDFLEQYPTDGDDSIFAAVMNNRVVSLHAKIVRSGTIVPIGYDSAAGARIYRRHLTLMLYEVFYKRYPNCHIRVGQAISEGYYFEVAGVEVDDGFLATISRDLIQLAALKRRFRFCRVSVEEARRIFANKGSPVKHKILTTWPYGHVGITSVGNFVDFAFGPVAPHTGYFDRFQLLPLKQDFVLQFPAPSNPAIKRNDTPQPKLYRVLKESRHWSGLMGVAHVGDLNANCIDGSIREVIKVAEGLHEKKLSNIADEISKSPRRRLVLIAGPSAAGKTTFTKRLSIQLMVNGLKPVSISLDNYYVDREKTPRHPNGEYDFEALQAIDLELFNDHLRHILNGKRVLTPKYDFNRGRRAPKRKWTPITFGPDNVLIIEGIHGLNDALTPAVLAEEKYRIYVNALNPLAIDEHNRLNTSDTRLIRRIVRDRHYRGYLASDTIRSWSSVRQGERRHIFPFQESADIIFDTSLIYEFSVLKVFAERYLLEVPQTHPTFAEAYRLRMFLAMFVPILPGDVPQTSLLREFIGGSSFTY